MALIGRKRKKGTTYYITFAWHGQKQWERSGTDKQEAKRLLARRRQEVKDGTYQPPEMREATKVGPYLRSWLEKRKTKTAGNDRSRFEHHVFTREWFTSMSLVDLRPRHMLRLIEEIKGDLAKRGGKPLAPKSVANIWSALRTAFRDARILELMSVDPCVVPKGTVRHRAVTRRGPYEKDDIRALVRDPRVEPNKRLYCALLFFTGMRLGEAAGRRWKDWVRDSKPLGALHVHSQYNDEPLKTEHGGDERPREVPVHPELAQMLAWWRNEGWELFYGRKPTERDFIVPLETDLNAPHTPSSAYRVMRTACKRAEVQLRGVHSSRRSFISLARRAGARPDVIERITHNSAGTIIDVYTFWDWKPLCEAVLCVSLEGDARGDAGTNGAGNSGGAEGDRNLRQGSKQRKTTGTVEPSGVGELSNSSGFRSADSEGAARHLTAVQMLTAIRRARGALRAA